MRSLSITHRCWHTRDEKVMAVSLFGIYVFGGWRFVLGEHQTSLKGSIRVAKLLTLSTSKALNQKETDFLKLLSPSYEWLTKARVGSFGGCYEAVLGRVASSFDSHQATRRAFTSFTHNAAAMKICIAATDN